MKPNGRFEFVTSASEREEGSAGLLKLPGLQSLWKHWGPHKKEGMACLASQLT